MAKRKKEQKQKVWTIGVLAESHTVDHNDGDQSGEPYSYRGTTSTSWDIRGLKLIEDPNDRSYYVRETTNVGFEPVRGELYHLLYAIYSTGDSFGHDEGRCLEVIGVYKDRDIAKENLHRLELGKPEAKGEFGSMQVLLKMEGTNKQQPYYRPWMGYFERLDRLEVESFELR